VPEHHVPFEGERASIRIELDGGREYQITDLPKYAASILDTMKTRPGARTIALPVHLIGAQLRLERSSVGGFSTVVIRVPTWMASLSEMVIPRPRSNSATFCTSGYEADIEDNMMLDSDTPRDHITASHRLLGSLNFYSDEGHSSCVESDVSMTDQYDYTLSIWSTVTN
jgi:hypothetical protein